MLSTNFLTSVPDFTHWSEATLWLNQGLEKIRQLRPEEIAQAAFASLEWTPPEELSSSPFGLYPSPYWRKFALSVFFADLASYPEPVDQVNFERLLFVLHSFPKGFRIWWIQLNDQSWWPIGYTGWYPMSEAAFNLFKTTPEKLKDRMVVPYPTIGKESPYLYLFNYSAVPAAQKSPLTRSLVKAFVEDVKKENAAGLACITVSEAGVRIATRLGLSYRGDLNFQGSIEGVYTTG